MMHDVVRWGILLFITVGGLAVLLLGFLTDLSGTWRRDLPSDERALGRRAEEIQLTSVGPFVSGKSALAGGRSAYGGILVFRTLFLARRDHGLDALMEQGFPEVIARQRDGAVAGRYILKVGDDGTSLVGGFRPQKVEYTHRPPKVTRVVTLAPRPRAFYRVEAVPAVEGIVDRIEERAEA